MSNKVMVTGPDGDVIADVSPTARAVVNVDVIHERSHLGEMFQADHVIDDVADAGVLEMLLAGAAGAEVHMRARADSEGNARIAIFEGPTVTVAGTAVAVVNRNRTSAKVSGVTVTHTPTTTADGTELTDTLLPGGSGVFGSGGQDDGFWEWVLAPGEDYLFRATNVAGTAKDLGLRLSFYVPGAAAP